MLTKKSQSIIIISVLGGMSALISSISVSAEVRKRAYGRNTFGEKIPGVILNLGSHMSQGKKIIALTVDLCDGRGSNSFDTNLIDLLLENKIKTTFFVSGRWVKHHRDDLLFLSEQPIFDIQNHGDRHRPASFQPRTVYGISSTRNKKEVRSEITRLHRKVQKVTHHEMMFYRPGTGFIDSRSLKLAESLGYKVIGYALSSGDAAHPFSRKKILANLAKAKPGDIVLVHGNHKNWQTTNALRVWIHQRLKEGFDFVLIKDHLAKVL